MCNATRTTEPETETETEPNRTYHTRTHTLLSGSSCCISIAMIIVTVPISGSNSIDVPLPHADMVPDPRGIFGLREWYKFRLSVNGRILTITRIDVDTSGWKSVLFLRAYLPTENIPDFTSTVYTYHGLLHEYAPKDTTEVIVHPSVTTIQAGAFHCCESLVRVTIPDTVTRIEYRAFLRCICLRFIQLPPNLVFIGQMAFSDCKSLEAVFLPPTVTCIGGGAFQYCTSLRFCNLPEPITHLGQRVFQGCNRLSTRRRNNLSKVCYSTSVNPQMIQECIQADEERKKRKAQRLTTRFKSLLSGWTFCRRQWSDLGVIRTDDQQMTALHILCANPHVTADCIRTYLQLAPEAANQQDSDGMTPFQHLCRNDITVFDDRSFSSLMIWWYCCMP